MEVELTDMNIKSYICSYDFFFLVPKDHLPWLWF